MPANKYHDRTGSAVVEFSLVIPVLLMLTFGTLEVCSAVFLKEKVTISAHEGARIAIKKMATETDAKGAVTSYLAARGVNTGALASSAIVITPQPERCEKLNQVSVRVRVPVAGNGFLPNSYYTWFGSGEVDVTVVMYKEFTHPTYEAELAAIP